MILPEPLIHSLQNLKGFNEAAFRQVHQSAEPVTSVRINPGKVPQISLLSSLRGYLEKPVPWSQYGYYLSQRPSFTFDPLFHAGCYYVQEASSMFVEQALMQTVDVAAPLKVLDLCAAPGGKSTHLQSLISKDSLLVSNEVIRQRVNILKDNIIKWGCGNVVVTHNDPRDFSKLKEYFDVVVVDAPCSGSGLFRRDEAAVAEWNEGNVTLCGQRQQRILADVMPALKEGGVLIYSTCSYSAQEDEDIMDWLAGEFQVSNFRLEIESNWNITEVKTPASNYGYRFWPHQVKGEGFFLAAFKKQEGSTFKNKMRPVTKTVTKNIAPIVAGWANTDKYELINVNNKIYAWPRLLFNDFDWLLQSLRVVYSGTFLGTLMHQKLIPDHALAMSPMVKETVLKTEVDLTDALAYLKKENRELPHTNQGWQMVVFDEHPLGWINVLSNRINNYYPKELRILKQ